MSTLLNLWLNQKSFFQTKSIEQILAISGDGSLRDDNETSTQLRSFFANIPASDLSRYIDECLTHAFSQGGLILQDLINEIGSRLGFIVDPGYYRGGGNKIGHDGIWRANNEYAFVIEVKTTDAYQINLDKLSDYRERLIEAGRISKDKSSILIIVGRIDTGGLEAQTRGSRHAWDVRLISVDSLLKLMKVKENLSDAATVFQIQEMLKPLEYTRVDRLINIIFKTSEDLQSTSIEEDVSEADQKLPKDGQSKRVSYHEHCILSISEHLRTPLIKLGRCNYSSADRLIRVLCIVSKTYQRGNSIRFWYAFHPSQQEFLKDNKLSYVALGCGNPDTIILMPADKFQENLSTMRTTESEGRYYWHVEVFKKGDRYLLNRPAEGQGVDITRYLIK